MVHRKTKERRAAIIDLVGCCEVRTQGELVHLLAGRGIVTSQPAVSRDLCRLGAYRVPMTDGVRCYVIPGPEAE